MTKRLLFVDDELELWESTIREELAPLGFEVKGEEDPSKALKMIAAYKPDIVLLDILFPNGNLGLPTLKKIKDAYPALPVMMISSTMDKSEYKSEDYALADYRYSKAALAGGDLADLAFHLNRLIDEAVSKKVGTSHDVWYSRFETIIGNSESMKNVALTVEKVADQDHTVLITGESGTGKELIARAIHYNSQRKERQFVPVDCAVLSENLLESELFGHVKGSFTGAVVTKPGLFEVADGGSLFLDEIGNISLAMQSKLLRFIQEREFTPVGGTKQKRVDVRLVAATNKNPKELIKQGRFREDLYFRLNVINIHIPALRERKEDIPLLFEHFIKKANETSKTRVLPILRDDVKDLLLRYPWPGNIRELENAISHAVALADENILQVSNFKELTEESNEENRISSHVSEIVDRIYKRELAWADLSKEFGAKGSMRREVLLRAVDRWLEKNPKRPSSEDLADLLSISPGNMRRILFECGIKLSEISK